VSNFIRLFALALAVSLLASPAFAHVNRTTVKTIRNPDGSVTTIKATTPLLFPLLRRPRIETQTLPAPGPVSR
jgi:hypothetical protein